MNKTDLCYIDDRLYYWGSISTSDIRCILTKLCYFLYPIPFGKICYVLITVIALISIFGKFQHNYRWFILNQVIWDIYATYVNDCSNMLGWEYKGIVHTCVTGNAVGAPKDIIYYLKVMYLDLDYDFFMSLLLLTFMRFLAIFFPNVYEKLTKNRRVFYLILIFNLVIISFSFFHALFTFFVESRNKVLREEWKLIGNGTDVNAFIKKDTMHSIYDLILKVLQILSALKMSLGLLLSICFTMAIMFRIAKQVKYQMTKPSNSSGNQKDFKSSIRISIVLLFQCFINVLVFCCDIWVRFLPFITAFEISLDTSTIIYIVSWNSIDLYIRQYRVFLECVITLCIMTGYRETIFYVFKRILRVFKKPNNPVGNGQIALFQSRSGTSVYS